MEELQRLRTSRRGYQAHTTKLLTGITDLLVEGSDAPTDKLAESSLALTVEQLQCKLMILEDLDARIAPLIDNEMDLEAEVIEAEDTRTKITEGIARLKVKLSSCPRTEVTVPHSVPRNLDSATPQTTVSSTSAPHTVRPTTTHTPHTSDDVHRTLAAATHGPIYSEAGRTPITEHTTVVSSSSCNTSRLPKLSIPTFTGDPLTWQSFGTVSTRLSTQTQYFLMFKNSVT